MDRIKAKRSGTFSSPTATNQESSFAEETFPPIEAEIVKKPRGGPVRASHAGKVYRRRFVSTNNRV
jgi:hypothetical protein